MAILIDAYSVDNGAFSTSFHSTGDHGWAQSFNVTATGVLTKVTFYLIRTGSPTGNATASLYNFSGSFGSSAVPSGAALATSDNIDVSTIPTSLTLVSFYFSGANQLLLTSGEQYMISIEYGIGVGDASNKIGARLDNSSPTHPGSSSQKTVNNTWSTSSHDMIFYIYVGPFSEKTTFYLTQGFQ